MVCLRVAETRGLVSIAESPIVETIALQGWFARAFAETIALDGQSQLAQRGFSIRSHNCLICSTAENISPARVWSRGDTFSGRAF